MVWDVRQLAIATAATTELIGIQTSGFGGIGAIVAANRVSRDLHVRPNVAGLGIPQMAQRTDSEDLGV